MQSGRLSSLCRATRVRHGQRCPYLSDDVFVGQLLRVQVQVGDVADRLERRRHLNLCRQQDLAACWWMMFLGKSSRERRAFTGSGSLRGGTWLSAVRLAALCA